jgi:hypothetical protein
MKWAVFLLSLRDYIETGKGKPSPHDLKIDNWNYYNSLNFPHDRTGVICINRWYKKKIIFNTGNGWAANIGNKRSR